MNKLILFQDGFHKMLKWIDKTELKAFLGLLYLVGLHSSNWLNLQDLWATDGSGIEIFRLTIYYGDLGLFIIVSSLVTNLPT